MRITAQKLNKGVTLSKSKLIEAMEVHTKKYYKACERLYSLGFLSAMYDFDEKLFKKALYQEFKEEFSLLKDYSSGTVDYSYERLEYAINSTSNYKFRVALLNYYDIKLCLEAFKCFEILWTKAKFKKSADTIVIKPKLVVISNIKASGVIPFHLEPMRFALDVAIDDELVKFDFVHILYKNLLKKVGVSTRDIESAERENEGLLTKTLSFKDESKYIYLFLRNSIELDGIYGKKVKGYIDNYYTSFYSTNTTKTSIESFEDKLFIDSLDDCVAEVNKFREEHKDYEEVFLSKSSVYFKHKVELKSGTKVSDFVGTCVLDAERHEELDKVNNLLGFSGEYVTADIVKELGYVCNVPPVRLYRKGKLHNYYPSFLVEVDEGVNFASVIGYEIKYNYSSQLTLKTIEGGIRFNLANSDISELISMIKKQMNLTDLEVKLLVTLCCIELDVIQPDCTSIGDVNIEETYLDYDDYLESCKKVALVYNSIKFK